MKGKKGKACTRRKLIQRHLHCQSGWLQNDTRYILCNQSFKRRKYYSWENDKIKL